MTFVLVNPQYINVRNPVMEETIMSQQEEIKHDHFSTEKTCATLLAHMQHKVNISSCIHD